MRAWFDTKVHNIPIILWYKYHHAWMCSRNTIPHHILSASDSLLTPKLWCTAAMQWKTHRFHCLLIHKCVHSLIKVVMYVGCLLDYWCPFQVHRIFWFNSGFSQLVRYKQLIILEVTNALHYKWMSSLRVQSENLWVIESYGPTPFNLLLVCLNMYYICNIISLVRALSTGPWLFKCSSPKISPIT